MRRRPKIFERLIFATIALTLTWSGTCCLRFAAAGEDKLILSSPAFGDGGSIPIRYAHKGIPGGENISLPLAWKKVPLNAKSLAIAMIDRHPIATNWIHWLIINIPITVPGLEEGASGTAKMPAGATELYNSFGLPGYGGPQPPIGSGSHPYEITIYALSVGNMDLGPQSSLGDFEKALQGKVLTSDRIVGEYAR